MRPEPLPPDPADDERFRDLVVEAVRDGAATFVGPDGHRVTLSALPPADPEIGDVWAFPLDCHVEDGQHAHPHDGHVRWAYRRRIPDD